MNGRERGKGRRGGRSNIGKGEGKIEQSFNPQKQ